MGRSANAWLRLQLIKSGWHEFEYQCLTGAAMLAIKSEQGASLLRFGLISLQFGQAMLKSKSNSAFPEMAIRSSVICRMILDSMVIY
jgi:hypothetical protein